MAHFPQTHYNVRAPRVSLRRPISIDFRLDEKGIVRGDLYVVSATGGRAQTPKPMNAGTLVELRIGSGIGIIRGLAEMLPGFQTINGWFQPFKFIALGDEDYDSLKRVLADA